MIKFSTPITVNGRYLDADGDAIAMLSLAMPEGDAKALGAELARRWNAFEPDGEVAQLRAEVEQLRAALNGLVALATPLVDDSALTFARAALGKGGRHE